MTPQDALGYIDSVLAQVPGTREQHIRIQTAMNVIARAVQPATPPPAANATPVPAESEEQP